MERKQTGLPYLKNWREVQPDISHMSAVHWGGLRPETPMTTATA